MQGSQTPIAHRKADRLVGSTADDLSPSARVATATRAATVAEVLITPPAAGRGGAVFTALTMRSRTSVYIRPRSVGLDVSRSAVALDRFLHARQAFLQILGVHYRDHLNLCIDAEEQALGYLRELR
jgi:plasmid stabilization system protein ParE